MVGWRFGVASIVPYGLWMVLMAVLPSTPWAYAVRTGVVAFSLLYFAVFTTAYTWGQTPWKVGTDPKKCTRAWVSAVLWGLLTGLAVFVVWVLPEQFDWAWYRDWCILGESGTEAIAESDPWLIGVRLAGSALVISIAEELFFRKWLIAFGGFWWMVALFAIEHDRYLVGAIAGVAYGVLYLRRGLFSAILAHALTNLVLGLWVLRTGQWQFW